MAKIYYISGPSVGAVSFNGQPITAQSVPVLDGWGPGAYWECAEWQAWHAELLKIMSAKDAALVFIAAWNKQDSFAGPYNWCKYNATFRNYMKSKGVDIDSVVSAVLMPIFTATGNIATSASDVVTNTAGAVSSVSSLAKPLFFTVAFAAMYVGYKTFVEDKK
jgi:hypothetical protein